MASCVSRSLRSVAVSLSEGRDQGLRSLLFPCTYVYPLPGGQGHRFCVHACAQTTATAAPDYNTTTSSSIASRRWSRVLAPQRVNPTPAVSRTCNIPSIVHTAAAVLQQYQPVRKRNALLAVIFTTKRSSHFRTEWCEGEALCSDL